jgi:hypothetical protein
MMAVTEKIGGHLTIVTLPKDAVLTIDGNLDAVPPSVLTIAVYQGRRVNVFPCDVKDRAVPTERSS